MYHDLDDRIVHGKPCNTYTRGAPDIVLPHLCDTPLTQGIPAGSLGPFFHQLYTTPQRINPSLLLGRLGEGDEGEGYIKY